MKPIQACLLTLVMFFYGLPIVVLSQETPQEFALPDCSVGEAYSVHIEAILRDQYGLKVDTGRPSSILQWFYVSGNMPPGINIRTNGMIEGNPGRSLTEAYRFKIKVVDLDSGSAPLFIDLSLRVGVPRIKLTKIDGPKLVPVETLVSQPATSETNRPAIERIKSAPILPYSIRGLSAGFESGPLAAAGRGAPASLAWADDDDSGGMSNLLRRSGGGEKTVIIDMPATNVPKPVEVKNETEVTISGHKRPVDTCAVATKREELKPEPNPLAQLLKVIIGFGAFTVADVPSLANLCPGDPPAAQVPADAEADQVEKEIKSIRRSLFANIQQIDQAHTNYEGMAKRISNFVSCKDLDGTTEICTAAAFEPAKTALKAAVPVLLADKLPAIESTELQLTTLKKVLGDRYKRPGGALEDSWIESVNTRLDCFSKNMESVKRDRDFLGAARIDLEKFQDVLDAHQTKFAYSHELLADANAKVTGTVSCTNFFTKQVSGEVVPFTVTYQNLPRASMSAGLLFSLLDKRQIGIQPVRTGTAADGTPTFRLQFAETDRGSSQVVPFSFFNYYLTGTRKLNLNLSGGVGLNLNNGSNQVEYFMGGALGIKNVFLQFGGHIGRWQELGNGFVLGDAVPEKFPAAPPIERRYTVRPGFGLSYKLPLP